MADLTRESALIFRITHIENVRWLLRNGLHCQKSQARDPSFVQIGKPGLIGARAARAVPIPPGGTLADYIPFYFTPFSPMMYNIKTGYGGIRQVPNSEIVILVSSLRDCAEKGVQAVFSDRHAYLKLARFSSSLDDLGWIDWVLLNRRDFTRDDSDPGKVDRYQAEALVWRHLPVAGLKGILCHGATERSEIEAWAREAGADVKIVVRPSWYFR
jgi:hypothetical protein